MTRKFTRIKLGLVVFAAVLMVAAWWRPLASALGVEYGPLAARIPAVVIGGQVAQLPAADTLLVAAGMSVGSTTFTSSGASTPSWTAGTNGRGLYVSGNELNQGYASAITDTMFISYSGHAGATSQFRNTWVGNGKNGAAPILYVNGVNNRVGINNVSPGFDLGVTGTLGVSGATTLTGNLSSTSGVFSWGPGSGNGIFKIDPGGSSYFSPFSASAQWGFGFLKTTSVISPIDVVANSYTPGTSSPRTDENPSLINGFATSAQFDTSATAIRTPAIFVDTSPIKAAGANSLTSVALRLDANRSRGSGGADTNVALWLDKGEFWTSGGHHMEVIRPTTVGYAQTSSPSLASCGAGAVIIGNDNGWQLTVGTGPVTACTVGFRLEWQDHTGASTIPACLIQSTSGVVITSWVPTSTNVVINSAALSGTVIGRCWGMDGAIPQ